MKSELTDYIAAPEGLRAISIVLVYLSHVIYYSGITRATITTGGFGIIFKNKPVNTYNKES